MEKPLSGDRPEKQYQLTDYISKDRKPRGGQLSVSLPIKGLNGCTISPLLMNIVLDGMEKAFLKMYSRWTMQKGNMVRYADEGFDFLSQNVRKFKGKLLIRPSKSAIQSFKDKIKTIIKSSRGIPAHALIRKLNPVIRGWSNYHKGICSKKIFYRLNTFRWWQVKRWAKYQHGNNNRWWIYYTN